MGKAEGKWEKRLEEGGCGCNEENTFKEEDKRKLKLVIELW